MLVKLKNTNVIKITAGCCILVLAVFLLATIAVHAADATTTGITSNTDAVGQGAGLAKTDVRIIVGNIIKAFIGLLGIIAICFVIYAGWLYMTAGGDPEKTKKAIAIMRDAAIGLAIIFSAYAITSYIFSKLIGDGGSGGLGISGGGLSASSYSLSGGAFGSVIQNQFPLPEQKDVPRNTMILVTFKIPINPDSVIDKSNRTLCPAAAGDNCGQIKNTFKVFKCADTAKPADCGKAAMTDAPDNKLVSGYAMVSEDSRTVIFNPYGDSKDEHLGSGTENFDYIVHLTAGITRSDLPAQAGAAGQSVFTTLYPDYKWRFATGTVLDLIPPTVTSVIPVNGAGDANSTVRDSSVDRSGKVYLNQIVVANFSEPVIPPLTQTQNCNAGDSDNAAQIINEGKVRDDCTTFHVPGMWKVGINNYKTIQFMTNSKCSGIDVNSCGEPVYCLPAASKISGKILAAEVQAGVSLVGTGITDLAGNSLDGNGDGKMDGQDRDNVNWSFNTGNALDLTPPALTAIDPMNASGSLAVDTIISATFNKDMDANSIDNEVNVYGEGWNAWVNAGMGTKISGQGETVDLSSIVITHGSFVVAQEGGEAPLYSPVLGAKVKDLRQNCFSPSKDTSSGCQDISGMGVSCCPKDLQTKEFDLQAKPTATCERP